MTHHNSEDAEKGRPAGAPRSNFIRDIVDEDLAAGKYEQVVTRFPPEPNGYLHIGHAKSICLNFGLARDYNGRCHLRFDDTNPLKENEEYVESMKRDVKWLGFDWGEHLYFASDYFDQMYEWALHLIRTRRAYVCSLSREAFAENHRGTIYEPGTPSPFRERSVEENLELFERMKNGEFSEGEHVLRASIDMSSPNMLMRDPPLYRIINHAHYRQGEKWHIYPMYDYAHCLEDAIEHVTHSICTLEFETNRELYDWVLDHVPVPSRPKQLEFARLSLDFTLMSKRKLLRLVEEGHVAGWDDPRMPTVAAFRRRGVTPESIRAFADLIGVAKANSTVDIGKLEYCIRDDLNHRAPRIMAVLDPLKVVITNYPEDKTEELDASYWPHDIPKEGSRKVPFSREIFIERTDFMEEPPRKWFRLAPGREVRLRYAYYVTCNEVVKDEDGHIIALHCTYDPETRGGSSPDGRKVKGTLHWVDAASSLDAEVRLYDRLFAVPKPDGDPDVDFVEHLNPDSLVIKKARVEPSIRADGGIQRYQFERKGYFFRDPIDYTDSKPVFNRTVSLRDSWAKLKKKAGGTDSKSARTRAPKSKEPSKPAEPVVTERDLARDANPELAARFARYQKDLGLDEQDADVLSGSVEISEFFESALSEYHEPESLARWIVNELMRELKDAALSSVSITPASLASLARMVDEKTITATVGKELFDEIVTSGADPAALVEERGLKAVTEADDLSPVVDEVLAAHSAETERYRSGEKQLFGFFIGAVMRATDGRANPKLVRELLTRKLS